MRVLDLSGPLLRVIPAATKRTVNLELHLASRWPSPDRGGLAAALGELRLQTRGMAFLKRSPPPRAPVITYPYPASHCGA